MDNTSEMKSYLRPSYTGLILPGLLVVLGIAALFVGDEGYIILLMMLALGGLCSISYWLDLRRMNKSIASYGSQYGADKLAEEFKEGYTAINGKLRLSDSYLFGQKTATVIRYEEIRKIYLYVHRTNGVEDQRALKIENTSGKSYILCNLPRTGEYRKTNHPDVNEVIKVILLKNPSVHVGYK